MNGGVIEQAGSPLELYHHPENLFVAGFIRSPNMNFLDAKAVGADASGVTIELVKKDRIKVDVAPGQVAEGEPLTLGVRPEHLRVTSEGGDLSGEVLVGSDQGGVHWSVIASLIETCLQEFPTRWSSRNSPRSLQRA